MSLISENARNTGTCPFCRELINKAAARCPHCHADLKTPGTGKKKPTFSNGLLVGFLTATLLWIILIIYLYFN